MIGKSIAHFEITAKIGEGGMGEVYQATDTKLSREVALKFLPLALQQDENARLRFIREAKAAAAIDHPFICSIYEVGETEDGQHFIAMEYVAGQTLQEKLEDGPIPLDKALPILIEAAEAIEKAHSAGFVHRDLKPANLMLTPEGHVKVMDFGLAKRILSHGATEQEVTAGLTREGSTLGTLSYMSPEQIRGDELDARSDIFSFGVVLYETLTGEHPFRRKQPMETAAAIMNEPAPPIGRYRTEIPYLLSHVIEKLLKKDPDRRYRDIHDVRTDLEDLQRNGDTSGDLLPGPEAYPQPLTPLRRQRLPWVTTGLAAAALLIAVWSPWRQTPRQEPRPPRLLDVKLSPGVELVVDGGPGPAVILSPDETMLAFVGRPKDAGQRRLYARRMDELEATPLPGTEGVRHPVFSPDGQWIAFGAQNQIRKISVTGGASLTLCENTGLTRGLAWGIDESIVFKGGFGTGGHGGLSHVSANGGPVEPLTRLDEGERSHYWPQVLPGGEWVLFTANHSGGPETSIIVQQIGGDERKVIWRGGYFARFVPSGHLVYVHESTLFAVAFDLHALEIKGQPTPVLEDVSTVPWNTKAEFSFSDQGTLAYVPGTRGDNQWTLEWLDREGNRQPLFSERKEIGSFRFSRDGHRLAMEIKDGGQYDIWIFEWEKEALTRLTFSEASDRNPVWSPDGGTIIFRSNRNGAYNLYWKRADGSGEAHWLNNSNFSPFSWHPSGRYLAVSEYAPESLFDIHILELEGADESGWKAGESTAIVESPLREGNAVFSPDGRWLAYEADDSGIWEVFVVPFPGPGGKRQISTGGGEWPRWSPNGMELVYLKNGQISGVFCKAVGANLQTSRPEEWSKTPSIVASSVWWGEPHPDGQRIAVRTPITGVTARDRDADELVGNRDSVVFIQNFFDYLREKVPVDQ